MRIGQGGVRWDHCRFGLGEGRSGWGEVVESWVRVGQVG